MAGHLASLQVFAGDGIVDSLTGTSGDDAIFYDFYSSRDHLQQRISGIAFIDAGDGNDIVDLTSSTLPDYSTFVTIFGNNGDDTIWSGSGNDFLRGGADNDFLWGGAGNDDIRGGTGNDKLYGFTGDDILECDLGTDRLSGGAGNDKFVIQAGTPGAAALNIIEDFTPGGTDDVLELRGFPLDFTALQSRLSVGGSGNLQLNLNGFAESSHDSGTIEFTGITTIGAVTSADFIFV
ncbi:MAG: calcium-binding protein [Geminicoccaceae bacterium]